MSRDSDRRTRGNQRSDRSIEDVFPEETLKADDTEASGGRRRRSQAAKLKMEETGELEALSDTDRFLPVLEKQTGTTRRQGRASRPERQTYHEDEFDAGYPDEPPTGGQRRSRGRQTAEEPVTPARKQPSTRDKYDDPLFDDLFDDDDESDSDDDDFLYDDRKSRKSSRKKSSPVKWIVLALVVLVLAGGATYIGLMRPDIAEPVIQWGRTLILGPTPSPSPSPSPTPEPTPSPTPPPNLSDASVIGFIADPPTQEDISMPILFRVTTSMHTNRVEIIDDDGQLLISGGAGEYTDTETAREWRLQVYFPAAYDGNVEVHPGNEAGWNYDAGAKTLVKVGELEPVPTEPPAPPEPEEGVVTLGAGIAAETVSVQTHIYSGTTEVETYARETPINVGDAAGYIGSEERPGMNGVLTFRGSGMRQNAAFGTVEPQENKLEAAWKAISGIASDGDNAFGAQPIIVQWHENLRQIMTLNAGKAEKASMREVIFAGNNGLLYFYDLDDGSETREAIQVKPTMPMLGTPSAYPIGYPIIAVGSGDPSDTNLEEVTGMLLCNLFKNSSIGHAPGSHDNELSTDHTFITSPLFDNGSDTLIFAGGNGMLFTMSLGTKFDSDTSTLSFTPTTLVYRSGEEGDDRTIDSSLAAYGEFAYFATNGGVLECVNLNTFENVWALNVGADTDAAIALENTDAGTVLYLASKGDVEGYAHLRRINAATGEVLWDASILGSITASPLVGTGPLAGTIVFTAMNAETDGTIYAINSTTGETLWTCVVSGRQLSSPIALYNEAGTSAWIIQGDAGGVRLLSTSGEQLDYLTLGSPVYGSPAAFNEMILIATQDGALHALRLK